MKVTLNLPKIRLWWMLTIIVFFIAVVGISIPFADNAYNNCLSAIVVNAIAAAGGAAPVLYAVAFKTAVPVYFLLAASTIRLLLAIATSSIILFFVKIDTVWFAAQVGILYVAVLVLEVRFFVKMMTGSNKVDRN